MRRWQPRTASYGCGKIPGATSPRRSTARSCDGSLSDRAVVLAGQPALLRLLKRDELEAVRQRIAHFASLRLLTRPESRQYIEHRLRIAGGKKGVFDDPSLDAIFEIARGNLRLIDHLALKAIELAAREGVPVVDPSFVTAARQKLIP
jgi:general secretion pathway protein A